MTRPSSHRARSTAAEPVPDGLVWVTDSAPGFRRVRHGDQLRYLDTRGKPLRDEAALARIRRLAIPPAYEDVWICAQANGHLQATGRDARGRKQYRYHPQWQRQRGDDKFESLRAFGDALPRIRRNVQRDLADPDGRRPTRTLVLATLVRLLDTTFVRIGNEEYARGNGSYGLTTLRTRHAGVRDAEVRLSFTGKSGVRHELTLSDRRVAAVVRRCKALPGQELFQYADADGTVHKVTSADVNDYLGAIAGTRVTAKDFRTWHGSVLALEFTRLACTGERAPGAAKGVIAQVAARLRNTAAVCRKSYIHPKVLALGALLGDDEARATLLEQCWAQAAAATRGRAGARCRRPSAACSRCWGLRRRAAPRATTAPRPGAARSSGRLKRRRARRAPSHPTRNRCVPPPDPKDR